MERQDSIPRVQTLAESGIQSVPLHYVRSDLEPSKPCNTHIPIIDLQGAQHHLHQDTIAAISTAAQNWGFFQIINHGIPLSLISRMKSMGKTFFDLPLQEKEKYKTEQSGKPGYGNKLGYSPDAKLDWGDFYWNIAWPAERRDMSKWPQKPSDFTEVMDEYSREIYKLWEVLMQVLSRGLGLEDENLINKAVGGEGLKEMHIRINYYPPCPQPEIVLGLSPHSDPNVLTFLLHDETPGLQIRKDGNWVDVQSVPGALIVNIADALEIVSNGRYKSVEHRSVVNKEKARISWAMFCHPHYEAVISPLPALIDKEHPALYQGSSWKEYLQKFFIKGLDGKGHVHQLQQS